MTTNDLLAESILKNLNTSFVGQNIIYYPQVTSTMDVAKEAANKGAVEGTAVIADEQVAGRGRLKRPWLSPAGSISLSLVLHPQLAHLSGLFMVASLAARSAIEKVTGLKADIKWPNDVLIKGRKVCGTLVENEIRNKAVRWAIIGMGMNVNLDMTQFPEIADFATSLWSESNGEVSRLEVIKSLLENVEHYYLALRRGQPIHKEWCDSLETLGKEVQVTSAGVVEKGIAESIDSDGCLLLRRPDGNLVRIVAGDVTLRS